MTASVARHLSLATALIALASYNSTVTPPLSAATPNPDAAKAAALLWRGQAGVPVPGNNNWDNANIFGEAVRGC
jgi:hypothetical protein